MADMSEGAQAFAQWEAAQEARLAAHRCSVGTVGCRYGMAQERTPCGHFELCDCGLDDDYGAGHCAVCFHREECHGKVSS